MFRLHFFNFVAFLSLIASSANAQVNPSTQVKRYSVNVGLGYFSPHLSDDGVSFPDAEYNPKIGVGFSYFISFDYALTNDLYMGVGFNGNYGKAKFIRNAVVNGERVNGYLEAGALENSHVMLNFTYAPEKQGIRPFARLGLGYFITEVELGDIPLYLTNNEEVELYPDFKSSGLGVMPELGLKYNHFSLSLAYGIPFDKLSGETPESGAYVLSETIRSHSVQINASYRILLF